jgi:ABC-type antimicrobial peptide transport system permease subunit
MSNLSYALNKEITYFDFIDIAKEDSEISSYKHHLFFKAKNTKLLKDKINYLSKLYDVDITSESIMITDTFNELMSAAIFGVSLFVLIALIGSLLILGIASFSSYVFEKRSTAIMYAFGINKEKVSSIFLIENILITSFSFIISLLLSPLLINGLNSLIFNIFGLTNLIINPLEKWTFSLVFIVICAFLLINTLVYLFTIAPIEIGGKVKIKEELSDE